MPTEMKRIKKETIELVLKKQQPRETFGDCLHRLLTDKLAKCKKKEASSKKS